MIDEQTVRMTLGRALRSGGEFAEIFVEDRRSTTIGLDDGRVEQLTTSRDRGAGIRVVIGNTTGFAHTTDLSPRGLEEAAAGDASEGSRSVALARGPAGGGRTVVLPPDDVAKAEKVTLVRRADDAARRAGADIKQVTVTYGDSRRRILVANSDGLLTEDDQVRSRMGVQCVAHGDAGMQTGFEASALTIGFELFGRDADTPESIAERAARRALAKLRARPAPSGVLPVVLRSGTGGMMIHEACGHGLEADLVTKKSSVYAGRLGDLVANPLVTLVDDGTLGDEWGTAAVDDEGRPAQRNTLIDNGVLVGYMSDWLRARAEGRPSSGNGRRESYRVLPMVRMTNTYLINGKDDPDEIVRQTDRGVYVAKLGGGQVNTATGDFVFGMSEAYLIENGEITEPLRDANLIGNGPEVLRDIDAIGNDFACGPGTCGKDGQQVPVGCGQPTLRITRMTVGGTAGG